MYASEGSRDCEIINARGRLCPFYGGLATAKKHYARESGNPSWEVGCEFREQFLVKIRLDYRKSRAQVPLAYAAYSDYALLSP